MGAEMIELLFREPIDKRRDQWMGQLGEVLQDLREKQDEFSAEALAANQEFITVLHRATDIALRTHQTEKHAYLRQAVANAASPDPPDLDKQIHFLHLIDELSLNQLLVLALYDNPAEWFAARGLSQKEFFSAPRIEVLNQAYPELGRHPYLFPLIMSGLERGGLIGGVTGAVTGAAVYDKATSDLASEFLAYVAAKPPESPSTTA